MKKTTLFLALFLSFLFCSSVFGNGSSCPVSSANTSDAVGDMNKIIELENQADKDFYLNKDSAISYYTQFLSCKDELFKLRMKTTVSMAQVVKSVVAAYLNRGASYFAKGEYEKAAQDYNDALSYESELEAAHVSLLYSYRGDAYKHLKNYNAAIKDYTKAIELKLGGDTYNMGKVYASLGLTYEETGSSDKAVENYKSAVYYGNGWAYKHLKEKYEMTYIPSRTLEWGSEIKPALSESSRVVTSGIYMFTKSGDIITIDNSKGKDMYLADKNLNLYDNFNLEATIYIAGGSTTSGNGIFFKGDFNNEKCCYLFNVTNDGRTAFYVAPKDPLDYANYTFFPIIPGQTGSGKAMHPAVKASQPNKLKAHVVGDFIYLYLNDTSIGNEGIDPDKFYVSDLRPKGFIGVYVSGGNAVQYSNIKIKPFSIKIK